MMESYDLKSETEIFFWTLRFIVEPIFFTSRFSRFSSPVLSLFGANASEVRYLQLQIVMFLKIKFGLKLNFFQSRHRNDYIAILIMRKRFDVFRFGGSQALWKTRKLKGAAAFKISGLSLR